MLTEIGHIPQLGISSDQEVDQIEKIQASNDEEKDLETLQEKVDKI